MYAQFVFCVYPCNFAVFLFAITFHNFSWTYVSIGQYSARLLAADSIHNAPKAVNMLIMYMYISSCLWRLRMYVISELCSLWCRTWCSGSQDLNRPVPPTYTKFSSLDRRALARRHHTTATASHLQQQQPTSSPSSKCSSSNNNPLKLSTFTPPESAPAMTSTPQKAANSKCQPERRHSSYNPASSLARTPSQNSEYRYRYIFYSLSKNITRERTCRLHIKATKTGFFHLFLTDYHKEIAKQELHVFMMEPSWGTAGPVYVSGGTILSKRKNFMCFWWNHLNKKKEFQVFWWYNHVFRVELPWGSTGTARVSGGIILSNKKNCMCFWWNNVEWQKDLDVFWWNYSEVVEGLHIFIIYYVRTRNACLLYPQKDQKEGTVLKLELGPL